MRCRSSTSPTPPRPSSPAQTTTGSGPWSVCVQGGYAYVTDYMADALEVFDVSDPAAPALAGSAATGDVPYSVCAQGGYAYVVNTGSDTLQVFDVSDPAAPVPCRLRRHRELARVGLRPGLPCLRGRLRQQHPAGLRRLRPRRATPFPAPPPPGATLIGLRPGQLRLRRRYRQ